MRSGNILLFCRITQECMGLVEIHTGFFLLGCSVRIHRRRILRLWGLARV